MLGVSFECGRTSGCSAGTNGRGWNASLPALAALRLIECGAGSRGSGAHPGRQSARRSRPRRCSDLGFLVGRRKWISARPGTMPFHALDVLRRRDGVLGRQTGGRGSAGTALEGHHHAWARLNDRLAVGGDVTQALHWDISSLVSPLLSRPNTRAIRPGSAGSSPWMSGNRVMRAWRSRIRAVVPMTNCAGHRVGERRVVWPTQNVPRVGSGLAASAGLVLAGIDQRKSSTPGCSSPARPNRCCGKVGSTNTTRVVRDSGSVISQRISVHELERDDCALRRLSTRRSGASKSAMTRSGASAACGGAERTGRPAAAR